MALIFESSHLVYKVAGMGPYDNNGYVIADPASREAYLVDAPADVERLIDEAADFHIRGVIVTHTHPDHVAGYSDLKRLTDLPVAVHHDDVSRFPGKPDFLLSHNEQLPLGTNRLLVLHTPGHTPGALCLYVDGPRVSGDTLFPGGPGRTNTARDFSQVVASIRQSLLILDGGTIVLPGHGADTTIAASKAEYAVFASREHPADLHGDVNWQTS